MNRILFIIFLATGTALHAQDFLTPAQRNAFTKPTSYQELTEYVEQLDLSSDLLEIEIAGKSVQGRNLYALKFSSSGFGKNPTKIKVLIFAQQHGNEQSGKEGALMLACELLKPENSYLFDSLDLVLVPQVNPDGSELNRRRNANEMDLNRNHLILTEPETRALHGLFDKYLFEVNMDVHEYSPFGETWQKYGYRNNSDILLGVTTNINVSARIRDLSNQEYIPFMSRFFNERGVSNFVYSPGGPPETEYIRHSTFDINDGRQSFGIQNTFSFIQEGLNGKDTYIENLEHRTKSQMTGMRGLLEYTYQNNSKIQKLIRDERKSLMNPSTGSMVSIQNEHVKSGGKLDLPVYSYFTGKDSIIEVNDYRPLVASLYDVKKPSGYLIPKSLPELTKWADRQALSYETFKPSASVKFEEYQILAIDSIDFEGDIVVNPDITTKEVKLKIIPEDYIYISTSGLKGSMLVIALEPKSMLGLVTYPQFSHFLKPGEPFPILRVVESSKRKHK